MADAEQRDATAPGVAVMTGGASAAEEDPVFMDDTAEATAARSGRLSTLSTLSADSDEFVPQAEAVDENGVQHATYRPRHAILPERSDEAVSDGDGNEWEPARAIRSSTKVGSSSERAAICEVLRLPHHLAPKGAPPPACTHALLHARLGAHPVGSVVARV